MNFRPKRKTNETDVDLTPLIDIIFILLIFFLVTASFDSTVEQAVQVDLPEGSSSGEIQAEEELTVYIQADGQVSLIVGETTRADAVSTDELPARLAALHRELGARSVFIRGDENVRYGEVVRVLDACRSAGFKRVFNVIRGQP